MNIIIAAIAALPLEQQSEWREIHGTPSCDALELDWRTLPRWTPEHREAVAVALHDWSLSQTDARNVLRRITVSDRRVGVWLACACARTVLRYVPANEDRPRLAIEAAERWVRGEAIGIDCGAAGDAAAAAAAAAARAARVEVVYACSAARAATASAAAIAASNARDAAGDAASYAAEAATRCAADAYTAWHATRTRFLRDLCQTIATTTRDALEAAAAGYDASEA